MSNDTVVALEREIQAAKQAIEVGQALDRLKNNRDFKLVITTGYFTEEAVRLVHLKAMPNMARPESQASIIQQIDAIGTFYGYLLKVEQQAQLAGAKVAADEDTLEELAAEELQ